MSGRWGRVSLLGEPERESRVSEHWGWVSLVGVGSLGEAAEELAGRAAEEQQALAGSTHTQEYNHGKCTHCPGTQAAGPARASPPTSLHNKPASQPTRTPAAAGRQCWECVAASASAAPSPRQRRRLQGEPRAGQGGSKGKLKFHTRAAPLFAALGVLRPAGCWPCHRMPNR